MPFLGTYSAGDSVRIWDEFVNQDGSPAAAADVRITIMQDDTTLVDAALMTVTAEEGVFYYDYTIPTDATEGVILCRTEGTVGGVRCAGQDTIQVSRIKELVKETRYGNQRMTFHPATVQNETRKVAVGVLDRIVVQTKDDAATDWDDPASEKTLFLWYGTLGDFDPIRIGESD